METVDSGAVALVEKDFGRMLRWVLTPELTLYLTSRAWPPSDAHHRGQNVPGADAPPSS